mmetsp:Transcript_14937/g.23403  ORF Transcript_14937/g.23403 Transcript_14937/m.23403 type:complete len:258 (-) Transcript_14937:936-1709(-)
MSLQINSSTSRVVNSTTTVVFQIHNRIINLPNVSVGILISSDEEVVIMRVESEIEDVRACFNHSKPTIIRQLSGSLLGDHSKTTPRAGPGDSKVVFVGSDGIGISGGTISLNVGVVITFPGFFSFRVAIMSRPNNTGNHFGLPFVFFFLFLLLFFCLFLFFSFFDEAVGFQGLHSRRGALAGEPIRGSNIIWGEGTCLGEEIRLKINLIFPGNGIGDGGNSVVQHSKHTVNFTIHYVHDSLWSQSNAFKSAAVAHPC